MNIYVEVRRPNEIHVEVMRTGAPGREIEIRKGTVNVEWRYVGQTEWQVLAPISDFMIGITSGPDAPDNPSEGDVWFQTDV